MRNLVKFFALFLIATQTYSTSAKTFNEWPGIVTCVTDGDTLWIRPSDTPLHSAPKKIRIAGIDAPEICQLYGTQSRAALKKLVASKPVMVQSKWVDDYGRDVAKITINNKDIGAWMVRRGHAWSYHYRHSAGPYRVEEEAAMQSRLGLFADSTAVEPKFFRREHGSCHVSKDAFDQTRKRYK